MSKPVGYTGGKSLHTGLVLTGGGARGAYQAGVLKRIAELPGFNGRACPFSIITGASAGAINAAALAAGLLDFRRATSQLVASWGDIRFDDVFRVDTLSHAKLSFRWVRDLAFGAIKGGRVKGLLDTAPLHEFLKQRIHFYNIQTAIDAGVLHALAVTTTNYCRGDAWTFIQGHAHVQYWRRSKRIALPTQISADHIYASSAIPFLFPAVHLETVTGGAYFGDGCLRMTAPLGPAIRLGASKLLAIGIRPRRDKDEYAPGTAHPPVTLMPGGKAPNPSLGRVFGIVLDSIFLDNLDADVGHLIRINDILTGLNSSQQDPTKMLMRPVSPLVLAPSVDPAEIAGTYLHLLPASIRFILNAVSSDTSSTTELASYLLFTSRYTQELMRLGYADASQNIDEIEDFLFSSDLDPRAKGVA